MTATPRIRLSAHAELRRSMSVSLRTAKNRYREERERRGDLAAGSVSDTLSETREMGLRRCFAVLRRRLLAMTGGGEFRKILLRQPPNPALRSC